MKYIKYTKNTEDNKLKHICILSKDRKYSIIIFQLDCIAPFWE